MKRFALFALPVTLMLAAGSAEARRLPGPTLDFGPNCHALYRATGQPRLFVGTVLGGQSRRGVWGDGTLRDYRTFQGCFRTAEACAAYVSRQQAHHPLPPGYARCTPVYVGLTPRG